MAVHLKQKTDSVQEFFNLQGADKLTMEWMTSTAGNGHLNDFITRYLEYLFSREQILRILGTAEELEEDRDGR